MAERGPSQDSGTNWPVVAVGGLILALAVAAIDDSLVRVIVAVAVLSLTLYLSQPKPEVEVENPLLEELRAHKHGLDRRKYGRLRTYTERLLDHVRHMNRIAIEGREGKIAPRHAHAELDRIAAMMRDTIDDIRKSAGVPTPTETPTERSAKPPQPKIVLPKAGSDDEGGDVPQDDDRWPGAGPATRSDREGGEVAEQEDRPRSQEPPADDRES